MKIDTYMKVLLTAAVLLLGVIAFDYRPNIEAKAGIMGGGEMILGDPKAFLHMKDGKFRFCVVGYYYDWGSMRLEDDKTDGFICSPFSDGGSK